MSIFATLKKQLNPTRHNHVSILKKKSVCISKVNGDAHDETQSACCDLLMHEIPKLNQKAVIMKLAHQSSHYTAGIPNQPAGKSSSGAHDKWSVNYERSNKQTRTAFGSHKVDSRRSTRPTAAQQPVGAATDICSFQNHQKV